MDKNTRKKKKKKHEYRETTSVLFSVSAWKKKHGAHIIWNMMNKLLMGLAMANIMYGKCVWNFEMCIPSSSSSVCVLFQPIIRCVPVWPRAVGFIFRRFWMTVKNHQVGLRFIPLSLLHYHSHLDLKNNLVTQDAFIRKCLPRFLICRYFRILLCFIQSDYCAHIETFFSSAQV